MSTAQDAFHQAGFDYDAGSPHLKHAGLRAAVVSSLEAAVDDAIDRRGRCRVLEVGAGHGSFSAALVAAGAEVVVTEMSMSSAERLRERFAGEPRVRVEFDHDGDWAFRSHERFDVVACLSVLHHIPDYVAVVDRLTDVLVEHGTFLAWQDPLWYPTQPWRTRAASTGAYFAWRLGRPDLRRGLATRMRRLRRTYRADRPEDMAEYHVVRDGVDQHALVGLLDRRYGRVRVHAYWSTQSTRLHHLGTRLGLANTFAIVARDRLAAPSDARAHEREADSAAGVMAATIVPPVVDAATAEAAARTLAMVGRHAAPGGAAVVVDGPATAGEA